MAATREIRELPVFSELDDPGWGRDFSWITDDLFQREYQGPMQTSWGGLVVYRNADIAALLKSRDVSHQSAAAALAGIEEFEPPLAALSEFFRNSTFTMWPPQHTPHKRLIAAPLAPAAISPFADRFAQMVRARIGCALEAGALDFLTEFAQPLVAEFWSHALDIPLAQCERLIKVAHDIVESFLLAPTPDALQTADAGAREYIDTLSSALRRTAERGTSTLVDKLVADYEAMEAGPAKPADPFYAFSLALLDGFNTLGAGMASLVHTLLDADVDLAKQKGDIASVARLGFLEATRLHPPVAMTMREAVNDFVLEDVAIPKGSAILVLWLFGNRDPEFFPDPDRFVLERENRIRQYTFAGGAYACAGRNIVQMLGEIVLSELSKAGVSIDRNGPAVWGEGSMIHELDALPLRFTRAVVDAGVPAAGGVSS
ncbi:MULTISPECIES: cytochrome P450 [Rhodococcus]|uniref:Cytochrome P450 n=1 Tax=Rhodococcus oxybenzonivorans TaxID=1990687 RepID=A0AAE4UW03_9NOCA|nr:MULTISPECIES: cytochrome P450 [Rhodococcus]MDV7243303.1 cytochrome P450 [Rhodococcus oxybenzonivorans]MDV7263996.1 cytochrome P450 [Rhodococcus oxybenzonivorans]MDV7276731.1 cytochrome P450 [Rhodococcus oxybenzonivorans]MDV7334438.1 cytochrome P450 [Rhodococcus oxybenzonivorans]MDV7344593.1 cytochrome P450 [Rhodococcus oxybenzonivorans]